MTDPRQPVLDHLANLRRERWKMAAWFGGMFVFSMVVCVMCAVWAAQETRGDGWRYWLFGCGLVNAWTAAGIVVRIRHHWKAILLMERTTRAQLAWLDLLRQDNDAMEHLNDDRG